MNKVFVIGNLTGDPELRSTREGVAVCSFNVAVNRKKRSGTEQEADFFRVTAWRGLGETCAKYLSKGKKVSVVGQISASAYIGKDGQARASLELLAEDVEFLSAKSDAESDYVRQEREAIQTESDGFEVIEGDDLPF